MRVVASQQHHHQEKKLETATSIVEELVNVLQRNPPQQQAPQNFTPTISITTRSPSLRTLKTTTTTSTVPPNQALPRNQFNNQLSAFDSIASSFKGSPESEEEFEPRSVEKEFRFGVELLPIVSDNSEFSPIKPLNYKIKKVIRMKLDINMNPICQLKKQIISAFSKEYKSVWQQKTEEKWLKSLKVQIFETQMGDFYDLDDWEQISYQQDENIRLQVFY